MNNALSRREATAGNSYVLHASLCLAFPPLGVCGCDTPVVVAEWLFCLHPPLGEMRRGCSEQVGDEVCVKLLGCSFRTAVPKLWFSTTLYALQRLG